MSAYAVGEVPFRSRLWACVSQNFWNGSACLAVDVAEQVIRVSGTDIIVYCGTVPASTEPEADNLLPIEQLERRLSDRPMVRMLCTNRVRTQEDALSLVLALHRLLKIDLVKLELLDDKLLPCRQATFEVVERLLSAGCGNVVPLLAASPPDAVAMERMGVPGLRVLGGDIGKGTGIIWKEPVREICRRLRIPVIIEGGIGTPAHAEEAMGLGGAAVLVNTAIVTAEDPVSTAAAFLGAVLRGREKLGAE